MSNKDKDKEKVEDGFIDLRKPLSTRHEKFCNVYCELLNGTQSYLSVYPNATYGSAAANASRLLKVDNVKERIAEIQERFAVRTKQDKNKTVRDLLIVAEEARLGERYGEYAKLRDMVIKLCGFYEPEKVEVKQSWSIGFGE